MGTPRRVWTSPRGARPPLMRCRKPRWAWDPLHGVWGPPEGYRPPPEGCETPRGRTTLTRTGRAPAQLHEDTWFAHAQRARTDGSGSASRKGAPLVFAVLCLRGCATVPWQPSLLRCRRLASSTASTLQGFPSGNESLRAWLRALRVPLSSPRCQEVIVQRFLIVSYPRGGSRAEQSTEQLRPPRPAARRSRWLVGSSRLGRNTR